MRRSFFILGIILSVLLASFWSEPAGWAWGSVSGDLAVALIFLVQGLSLATRRMLSGVFPLRLHSFVLGWNFLFFPFLTAALMIPMSLFIPAEMRTGFIMLAILPGTIASATAFTVAAAGAVPQSIFASILSNLLAIVIVPLWLLFYLRVEAAVDVPLGPVFQKLCLLVVLPLLAGQFLRRCNRKKAAAFSKAVKWLPELAILFIVYLAFAQSFQSGAFESIDIRQLLPVVCALCLLFACVNGMVWLSTRWLRVTPAERIAAFFCSSQKSLATGLPLLASILSAAAISADASALYLLPLIIYHPLQLVGAGLLLPRLRLKPADAALI